MKQETLQLTTGGDTAKRRALDFYPTPMPVTIALMDFLQDNNIIPHHKHGNKTIWEPACGNGKMVDILKAYHHKVLASDIAEECIIDDELYPAGNSSTDFLDDKVDYSPVDAIITNPPFNKSVLFIEKAIRIAPVVAMLLKSQYWHSKSRYNLFMKHPPAYVLPLTWRPDFLEHERKKGEKKGAPTMEVAWSVWIRGQENTIYKPLLKPVLNWQDI